jgi:ABC-type polar amino acid transport system ATPase subunit
MTTAMLSIDGLSLWRETTQVLRDVHLEIRAGERVALMGLSGGGKTTVLRAVCALDRFQAGRIRVDGFELEPGPIPRESHLRPLRRLVGMVFQFHHLFAHLSAVENVALALVHVLGVPRDEARARARTRLESLGVGARGDAMPAELSGGEAQRVAIARALALDPPLLLMDEPTASLDPARRGDLAATLVSLTSAGRTLLVATHDVPFARAFATRIVVLAEGRVVEDGRPQEVLARPAHAATRELLAATPAPAAPDRQSQDRGAGL